MPRTLYHTLLSPFCRKVRVLLREKDLAYNGVVEPPIEFSVKVKEHNPANELPILIDEDGTVVCGSYPICEYIDDCASANYMLGNSIKERAEIRRIVDWFDRKFYREVSGPLLKEKYIKTVMRNSNVSSEAVRYAQRAIQHHLDIIGKLHNGRTWLAGDTYSLADITAAAHLSCVDYFGDVPWEHNVDAKEWYALMKSRPAFRTVLADRVATFRPPDFYEDPDF